MKFETGITWLSRNRGAETAMEKRRRKYREEVTNAYILSRSNCGRSGKGDGQEAIRVKLKN